MAWVTVETNEGQVILRVNTALHDLGTHLGMRRIEETVIKAVGAAEEIEEPLESLKDDE